MYPTGSASPGTYLIIFVTALAPQSNTEDSYEDAEVITASSIEEEDDLILTNPRSETAITLIFRTLLTLSDPTLFR